MKALYFSYNPYFSVSHIPLGGLGASHLSALSSQFDIPLGGLRGFSYHLDTFFLVAIMK